MRARTIDRTKACLSDLPQEILHDIAAHLDIHTSVQLASTASQYRIPAEKQVWSSLSIPYKDLVAAHPRFDHTDASPPYHLGLTVSCSIWSRVESWKGKSLTITIIDGVPTDVIELLEKVSQSLEEFMVCTSRPSAVTSEAEKPIPLHQLFSGISQPFLALKEVRIAMKADLESTLPALLDKCPNMVDLHIFSQGAWYSNIPASYGFALRTSPLPRTELRKLVWDSPGGHVDSAAELVRASPLIEHLQLLDVIFEWQPKADDTLIAAISTLEHLVGLDVPHPATTKLATSKGALDKVTHVSVTWTAQGIFEAKRNPKAVIPPLPNLKTYQFDVSTAEPSYGGIHISTLFPHIDSLRLLASSPLAVYTSCPELTMIYCPSPINFDKIQAFPPTPPDWKEHSFQGIIVYSFSRSSIVSGESDGTMEELIHVRSHVATTDVPCKKERCLVCPMGWEDRAWWRGIEVPINVLGAAYMAAGIQLGLLDPTRGSAMGRQGWKVMEYWYDTREW